MSDNKHLSARVKKLREIKQAALRFTTNDHNGCADKKAARAAGESRSMSPSAKPQSEKQPSDFRKQVDEAINNAIDRKVIPAFRKIDQRFDAVDKKFVAVDQRFDDIDQKFAQVDQRFVAVEQRLGGVEDNVHGLRHEFNEFRSEMKDTLGEILSRLPKSTPKP